MRQDSCLRNLLFAGQLPGFRALGRFWAVVGLTLGAGTAVLGYLGPPEAARTHNSGVDAALAMDRTAGSGVAAALEETSRAIFGPSASPSTPPPRPAPMLDSPTVVSGMATSSVTSEVAGQMAGVQMDIPVNGPPTRIAEAGGLHVEATRHLRIHTGKLNIVVPETLGGDVLTATIQVLPRGMVRNNLAVLKVGDRLRPEELAALVFVPEPGFTGPAGSLRYLVEDSHGSRAEGVVEIDVIGTTEAAAARHQAIVAASAAARASPPRVVLVTDRGARPVYRVGDSMTLRIQPMQDAYIYCYYQDDTGRISRIFPNRFQPDAFVPARVRTEVPPAGSDAFSIRFERVGVPEQVACFGASEDVEHLLPQEWARQDLKSLPVHRLDEVAQCFHKIAGVQIDAARLAIEVTGRRVNGSVPSFSSRERRGRPHWNDAPR